LADLVVFISAFMGFFLETSCAASSGGADERANGSGGLRSQAKAALSRAVTYYLPLFEVTHWR
jgi:hypothetical protein